MNQKLFVQNICHIVPASNVLAADTLGTGISH